MRAFEDFWHNKKTVSIKRRKEKMKEKANLFFSSFFFSSFFLSSFLFFLPFRNVPQSPSYLLLHDCSSGRQRA
jgi:hypothetical protein